MSAITRRDVLFYTVAKKKINKNVEGDTLKTKVKSLIKAREIARELYRNGNFKSLTNSNDVSLPL
tara:strand:+ start:26712 stop:26906 length:195 start_codon:yes stop_codon:yes gene_type:complete